MILDSRITAFIEWFADFLQRFGQVLESALVPQGAVIRVPLALGAATGAQDDASRAIARAIAAAQLANRLENGIKPVIAALRTAIEDSSGLLADGAGSAQFLAELAAKIDELPEELELRDADEDGVESVSTVPLRGWFAAIVLAQSQPAMTEAVGAAQEEARLAMRELDRLQKVLDYYLLAVQRHTGDGDQPNLTEDFAQAGLERTKALLEQFRARRHAGATRVRAGFVRRMSIALEEACAPLRSRRAVDVARRLEAIAQAERERDAPAPLWRVWRDRAFTAYSRGMPVVREVARDLRLLFRNEELPIDDGLRRLVSVPFGELGSQLPSTYRRLFVGLPSEIADIYVPRPDVERTSRAAIDRWLRGSGDSLLLQADRGGGKRTLINQVLASIRSEIPVNWVRLSRDVNSEADCCRTIGRELDLGTPATFGALERSLRGAQGRRALVVENTERLFRRSPTGLARTAAFLDLAAATGQSTLWILLLATPAAGVIGNALDLGTRITTVVVVPSMDVDDLRRVVLSRHALSGYELHFEPGSPRAIEQLRRPLASMRARRDPEAAYFDRLTELTQGNPRQALYYWLRTVELDPARDRMLVRPLPDRTTPLVAGIPIGQMMALALIAQYGSLTVDELAEALGSASDRALSDIRSLHAVGWVERALGEHEHWTLSPVAAHPLTLELREHNMV